MKTMTCRDLGGSCDQKLSAHTWHDMVQAMTKHVLEKHPAAGATIRVHPVREGVVFDDGNVKVIAFALSGLTASIAGILSITDGTAVGVGGSTTVASGASLELQNGITLSETLTLSGVGFGGTGAVRNLSGNNVLNGTLALAAATTIQSDAGLLTLNTAVTVCPPTARAEVVRLAPPPDTVAIPIRVAPSRKVTVPPASKVSSPTCTVEPSAYTSGRVPVGSTATLPGGDGSGDGAGSTSCG